MSARPSALAALCGVAALALLCAGGHADVTTMTAALDRAAVKPLMGFGVQLDPYSYPPSPADWRLTVKRLDHLHPAFFRVMMQASYCLDFDAQGKPEYVWDRKADASPASLSEMAMLTQILDYAQARDVDVMLGEWTIRGDIPMKDGSRPFADVGDPRWARIITDFVTYLKGTRRYSCIKYYNYVNEPNGSWMGPVNYPAWSQGIRQLHADFDKAGVTGTAIVGPDNSGDWDWLDRSAHDLPNEIGDWEMHWYATDDEIRRGEVERLLSEKGRMLLQVDPHAAGKRWFMGEAGDLQGRTNGDQQPRVRDFDYGVLMADYAAQVLRAGWLGASAWDLDDAMHPVADRTVPPGDKTLKVWGFWNTQAVAMGRPEDLKVRPWFYTWSLMANLFPPEARAAPVDSPAGVEGLRAVACVRPGHGVRQWTVMLVNEAEEKRTVRLRVPGAGRPDLRVYHYFQGERPVDADGFPVPQALLPHADVEHGLEVTLPSRGVVFLTSLGG